MRPTSLVLLFKHRLAVCPTLVCCMNSEQLARMFKYYDIPVYHKPVITLRSLLVHATDNTDKAAKCGVIYDIQCPDYNQHYIRKPLGTRLNEHPIGNMRTQVEHRSSVFNIQLLYLEDNWHRSKIKEAINIRRRSRYTGQELVAVMLQLVSHLSQFLER